MIKSIFITVRNGSTRLENKALMQIDGIPVIEYIIRRMKFSAEADHIILCTTEKAQDDSLVEMAVKNDILFFRGSEEDKLERWRGAAEKFNTDYFCTADGDDLFCEPRLIDMAFRQFESSQADFIESKTVITGAFTYGIKAEALNKVCEIKDSDQTEMMWVYFTGTGLFNCQELQGIPEKFIRSDIRMTLDYAEDFSFFDEVIKKAVNKLPYLTLDEITDTINKYPEIAKINFFRQQQWADNQKSKTVLKLKGQ